VGNDVALTPGDRQQLVDPFAPTRGHGLHWHDQGHASRTLDLATLLRVMREWKWLAISIRA